MWPATTNNESSWLKIGLAEEESLYKKARGGD